MGGSRNKAWHAPVGLEPLEPRVLLSAAPEAAIFAEMSDADGDAHVAARYVFYNASSFDGRDAAANASDDAAIATDKEALLPGEVSSFVNYTSYDRGINGLMIDVQELASPDDIDASDFALFTVNDNASEDWQAVTADLTVSVRDGEGVDGSDRVTLVLPDGAVTNSWLRVEMLANEDTGLPASDVFYFGNAIADSGDSDSNTIVDATDELEARNNQHNFLDPAAIDDAYDYNRDARVDATDELLARNNQTNFLTRLSLVAVPEDPDAGETIGEATDIGLIQGAVNVTGTIGIPDVDGEQDPIDVYRFRVDDFLTMTVDVQDRTDGTEIFLLRDNNANGEFDTGETWRRASAATGEDFGFTADLAPGEYYFWLRQFNDGDATPYNLQIDTSEFTRGPIQLTSGQTVSESIGELGEFDFFTIDAESGETLFLNFSESGSSSFFPGVFIYNPDGSLLSSSDNFSSGTSFSDLELTQTGTYTVVVRDLSSDATGPYVLTAVVVDEQVDADNVALTSGETFEGDLASGDIDTFTIDAESGESLFLNFSESGSSSFFPGVFIYNPDGSLLSSSDNFSSGTSFSDLELTQTGTYTVVVRDLSSDATGPYVLTAVVVDEQVDADNVALTSGETFEGDLASGDIDTFTIDAESGESLFLNFSESGSSSFRPGVFIYNPDGSLLASDDNFSFGTSFTDLELTQSGTYTVVARDLSSDAIGPYALTVTV